MHKYRIKIIIFSEDGLCSDDVKLNINFLEETFHPLGIMKPEQSVNNALFSHYW